MKIEHLKFFSKVGGKSFIGLKYINNIVEIHYPRSFHWKNQDMIKNGAIIGAETEDIHSLFYDDIRMLLLTITLAKSLSEKEERAANILASKEDFALLSYIWIVKDYMVNGFYKNREPVDKLNASGRINWKKTMNRQPIVSNGNIIYPCIVSTVKNNSDNIITEIYRFCVHKSVYLIGWLFGLNEIDVKIKNSAELELSEGLKQKYNYYLEKELNSTFDDIKRERLENMRNIINGLNKSVEGTLVYGVNEYHYVFERMIDSIYGTEDTKDYHPKGVWHTGNGIKHESSSLEPDTILIKNDTCVVIDSKCYGYFFKGFENNSFEGLPQTSSIQKQITYGDHIYNMVESNENKITIDKNKIYNCFLIPFNKIYGDKEHNNIEYVMYADVNLKETSLSYDKIFVFFIDMRHVIETWNNQNHSHDIDELINQIINVKDKTE